MDLDLVKIIPKYLTPPLVFEPKISEGGGQLVGIVLIRASVVTHLPGTHTYLGQEASFGRSKKHTYLGHTATWDNPPQARKMLHLPGTLTEKYAPNRAKPPVKHVFLIVSWHFLKVQKTHLPGTHTYMGQIGI